MIEVVRVFFFVRKLIILFCQFLSDDFIMGKLFEFPSISLSLRLQSYPSPSETPHEALMDKV